jgi:hypothetical protein
MALTKFNYNSFDLTTAASKGLAFNSSANGFETSSAGSMTLIKTLTASSDSTISFVHGSNGVVLDSTYPVYLIKYINIHGSVNNFDFGFNFSVDTGSNYNVAKTTTYFRAYHTEADASGFGYRTDNDLAQGTGRQNIIKGLQNENDNSGSGEMYLFNPSSTTFVKHFMAKNSFIQNDAVGQNAFIAGYGNTTSAIDAIQFSAAGDNIDSGTFKLYGIKDS